MRLSFIGLAIVKRADDEGERAQKWLENKGAALTSSSRKMTSNSMEPSVRCDPIADAVYSIRRLKRALSRGGVLPAKVRVGGRYSRLQGQPCLHDALDQVLLVSALDAEEGAHVVVDIETALAKIVPFREARGVWPWAEKWSEFLRLTRHYFHNLGLVEVTTPSLVYNPGMEPELEPFVTEWRSGGALRHRFFLPTSPELHLKQLLSQDYTDIFEIKSVFRNEELTDVHEPEFLMLEWYRGFADLEMIVKDLEGYIRFLAESGLGPMPAQTLPTFTVRGFWQEFLGHELTPQTTREELLELATRKGAKPGPDYSWNDAFHLIWVSVVEPRLPQTAFLLRDYPPSQAALAKLNSAGWADRVELYWRGFEIANGYHELTDPREQRARFERDQGLRHHYGRTPLDIDENFMSALERGIPPSAGIALGLDRLFMALMGIDKIKSTRPFGAAHQFSSSSART